ncbi:DUF4258 domain-containing protein [Candidatus Woesearchaeota archaeon]|nr:DUF4258 domain-containing protein [Candidatus Woesearchaeota archaeon]
MEIIYSDHARKRMRQRGVTELEVRHVLAYSRYVKKSFEGRKLAEGSANGRVIRISFIETENFIKIITVM